MNQEMLYTLSDLKQKAAENPNDLFYRFAYYQALLKNNQSLPPIQQSRWRNVELEEGLNGALKYKKIDDTVYMVGTIGYEVGYHPHPEDSGETILGKLPPMAQPIVKFYQELENTTLEIDSNGFIITKLFRDIININVSYTAKVRRSRKKRKKNG